MGDRAAPPISPDTTYIKSGSFGATFRPAFPNKDGDGDWEQHENDVVKLFFDKEQRNEAKKKANEVYSYTENDGHKSHLYKFSFLKKDLPEAVIGQIPKSKRNLIGRELYPLRMPNLGVDMGDIIMAEKYRPLRQIPIKTMLEQVAKVISQVQSFVKKDRIHSDIRETNMMINAKTGAITIIDFDFFKQSTKFYREDDVAFYNRPPENYLYCVALDGNFKVGEITINPVYGATILQNAKEKPDTYTYLVKLVDRELHAAAVASGHRKFDLQLYMEDNNNLLFRSELGLEITDRDALIEIIRKNTNIIYEKTVIDRPVDEEYRKIFENAMMPYFDTFGLGLSLLNLFVATYTKFAISPKYTMETAVKNMLRSGRFSKAKKVVGAAGAAGAAAGAGAVSYEAYTYEELEHIYLIVQCVFYSVLLPMIGLDITKRVTIDEAFDRMKIIISVQDDIPKLKFLHNETIKLMKAYLDSAAGRNTGIPINVKPHADAFDPEKPTSASPKGAAGSAKPASAKSSPKGAAGAAGSPKKSSGKTSKSKSNRSSGAAGTVGGYRKIKRNKTYRKKLSK